MVGNLVCQPSGAVEIWMGGVCEQGAVEYILGLSEKWQEDGDNCINMSIVTYALHQIASYYCG
jgi:hypothetical protein